MWSGHKGTVAAASKGVGLNTEESEVRMQLSDGGARLGASQECQNGLVAFSAYGCM